MQSIWKAGALFCACVVLCLGAVKFPQCKHVYAAQKQQRVDNEWLRDKCNEPVFFTRMSRQRPEVCAEIMSTYDQPAIVAALRECFAEESFWFSSRVGRSSTWLYLLFAAAAAAGIAIGVPSLQSRYSHMRALQLYKRLLPRYGYESKYVV